MIRTQSTDVEVLRKYLENSEYELAQKLILKTIKKKKFNALFRLGICALNLSYLSLAFTCFAELKKIDPKHSAINLNLSKIFYLSGDIEQSISLLESDIQFFTNKNLVASNLLMYYEYSYRLSSRQRFELAKNLAPQYIPDDSIRRKEMGVTKKLRVGFVSGDFNLHPVGRLLVPFLENYDRTKFDVFLFHTLDQRDTLTQYLGSLSSYENVANQDDRMLTEYIMDKEINVLIDLAGHSKGGRMQVFANKPAPIQICWIGYFATTGLDCFDAIFLDKWLSKRVSQADFSEPIVDIASGRFCFQPSSLCPSISNRKKSLDQKNIVFGSFNNTAKYGNDVISTWSQVLTQVPGSVILLKNKTFRDTFSRKRIYSLFENYGIADERIILENSSNYDVLLSRYNDIDICLDPFPFSGGYTSLEALWMGCPVITLAGDRISGLQTQSYLEILGLEILVAPDIDQYIKTAVGLAKRPDQIGLFARTIRSKLSASCILDVNEHTKNIENAIIKTTLDPLNSNET